MSHSRGRRPVGSEGAAPGQLAFGAQQPRRYRALGLQNLQSGQGLVPARASDSAERWCRLASFGHDRLSAPSRLLVGGSCAECSHPGDRTCSSCAIWVVRRWVLLARPSRSAEPVTYCGFRWLFSVVSSSRCVGPELRVPCSGSARSRGVPRCECRGCRGGCRSRLRAVGVGR